MTKPVPCVEIFDGKHGAIAVLALPLDQLTTVRNALWHYASIRDPEVDPKRIAEKLAATIDRRVRDAFPDPNAPLLIVPLPKSLLRGLRRVQKRIKRAYLISEIVEIACRALVKESDLQHKRAKPTAGQSRPRRGQHP